MPVWNCVFSSLYYCVSVKRITLCNCLCCCCSSCFSASVIRNIEDFGAKNSFTDHQTANKYTVLGIQFWPLKYTNVIRIHKNLSNFPFLTQAITRIVIWSKQPTSNSFQTLRTVYTYSNCTTDYFLYCWKKF